MRVRQRRRPGHVEYDQRVRARVHGTELDLALDADAGVLDVAAQAHSDEAGVAKHLLALLVALHVPEDGHREAERGRGDDQPEHERQQHLDQREAVSRRRVEPGRGARDLHLSIACRRPR